MKHYVQVGCLLVILAGNALSLANAQSVNKNAAHQLRLVELFTSHGCSSCPAADKLLAELLRQDETLMALEYHVDYWNTLVHGSAGNWVDPFSRSEYSTRQREYAAAGLSGQPGVYTPQVIVNGRVAAVGSDHRLLQQALSETATQRLSIAIETGVDLDTDTDTDSEADIKTKAVANTDAKAGFNADVNAMADANANADTDAAASTLRIRISGEAAQLAALDGTPVSLVRYIDEARTPISAGENMGRELVNHHIVYNVSKLGQVQVGKAMEFTAALPAEGEGCIVTVQDGALTSVFAAAECP
jgi:hypothetical protein